MSPFTPISSDEKIATLIEAAFDTKLPVVGGWGYHKDDATIIQSNPNNLPLSQIEHMLASMRAYLEMSITQPEPQRYGSINLNEKERETITEDDRCYHKVIYEISAMKESDYATFIEEYKEGYGSDDFNMEAHFQRRKEATLIRHEPYWFEVSALV